MSLSTLPSDDLRLRFLEEGLRTAQKARRLDRRAEWVIQAAVRLNASRRRQVQDLLLRRLRDPFTPLEVRSACVMLGIALDIQDARFGMYVGVTILWTVIRSVQRGNYQDVQDLSKRLKLASARLDAASAARAADLRMDVMSKITDLNALNVQSRGLSSVNGRLDAAEAAKAADLLVAAMSQTTDPNTLNGLSNGLASVLERVAAAAAAPHAAKAADLLVAAMSKTTETDALSALFQGLSSLIHRLDVASAVNLLKTIMSKHTFDIANVSYANAERWNTLVVLVYLQHPLVAGQAQRQLLDVLEHRTRRHFRNTLHFLNWARSNGVDFVPAN